jgi:hypothetical protein
VCKLSNVVVIDHTKYLHDFCCHQMGITETEKIQFLLSCSMTNTNNNSATETMLPVFVSVTVRTVLFTYFRTLWQWRTQDFFRGGGEVNKFS